MRFLGDVSDGDWLADEFDDRFGGHVGDFLPHHGDLRAQLWWPTDHAWVVATESTSTARSSRATPGSPTAS